jgi:Na+/melibiose symporter-like transporter
MVTGYIGGGLVTRYYGYFTIFVTMQVLSSITVLLTVACTETLVPEMRQRHVGWKQANLWAAVAVLGRNRNVAILAGVFVLQIATRMGVAGVAILYVRHMFNWKADKVTYYLALDSACKGLALFVTIPLVEWLLPRRSFFRHDLTLIRASVRRTQNRLWLRAPRVLALP